MVGVCGIIGEKNTLIDNLIKYNSFTNNEKISTFEDKNIDVAYIDHPVEFEKQPSTAQNGNIYIWCWGSIIGHENENEYVPKEKEIGTAEYCAELFDSYGYDFVSGLNNNFAGVIYDTVNDTVTLFTDRLGARPIYYTKIEETDTVVFSPTIQSLCRFKNNRLKIDKNYLSEYLSYNRVFGIYTPISNVFQLPPASIVTFNMNGRKINEDIYWWPDPSPRNVSYGDVIEDVDNIISRSISEHYQEGVNTGLLLSGGTDSRLLLDKLGQNVKSYHMNEFLDGNREAETAKKISQTVGSNFHFLKRDVDYYPRVFKNSISKYNFSGMFYHAHAQGFKETFESDIDVLFSGEYSDAVFSGLFVPKSYPKMISGILEHLFISDDVDNINSKSEYAEAANNGKLGLHSSLPSYTENIPDPTKVLTQNIQINDNNIQSHGVKYPNWQSLVEFGKIYPITNVGEGHFFYESVQQIIPTKYPFLDNRLIDLVLQIPTKYRFGKDIISDVLTKSNKELAKIRHPGNLTPIYYPYPIKYYMSRVTTIIDNIKNGIKTLGKVDGTINDSDPWPDHEKIIRKHKFVGELINKNQTQMERSEYIDYQKVIETYSSHMDGDDRTNELYTLVALLESSIEI